jgi:hypothetical protein
MLSLIFRFGEYMPKAIVQLKQALDGREVILTDGNFLDLPPGCDKDLKRVVASCADYLGPVFVQAKMYDRYQLFAKYSGQLDVYRISERDQPKPSVVEQQTVST